MGPSGRLLDPDLFKPLRPLVAEDEGDEEDEVHGDDGDEEAEGVDLVGVDAEGDVEGDGRGAAKEGAKGNVHDGDFGEAQEVVADAKGDGVDDADGDDDEKAVVAQKRFDAAEFFQARFDAGVEPFS